MNTNTPTPIVVPNSLEDFLEATQRKALMALNECLDSAETLKERMQVITTIARFKVTKPPATKHSPPAQPPPSASPPPNPLRPVQMPPDQTANDSDDGSADQQDILARVDALNAVLDSMEQHLNARERATGAQPSQPTPIDLELLDRYPTQPVAPVHSLALKKGASPPIESSAQRIRRAAGRT